MPSDQYDLPAQTLSGRARQAALRAIAERESYPTSVIEYRSRGALLILGPEGEAAQAALTLKDALNCVVLVSGDTVPPQSISGAPDAVTDIDYRAHDLTVLYGRPKSIEGHLGAFSVIEDTPRGEIDLAQLAGLGQMHFDLILDLADPPFLHHEIPPVGYYAVGGDRAALRRALEEMPAMVGTFEKPQFFHYDPDICAHGRAKLIGCTRCIDACPTQAITSLGDGIGVDPYLCQGMGSCATACPTGAISYAYPQSRDLLASLRQLLKAYRDAGGERPCVLFHDAESGRDRWRRLAAQSPECVLPVEINELGSAGMDVWLAALAYGAGDCLLLDAAGVAPSVRTELQRQLGHTRDLLAGMGYPGERLCLLTGDDRSVLEELLTLPSRPETPPASFATFNEKRTTIRVAVDHLFAHAPRREAVATLSVGAPFGEVLVDREACTLCMGCVSVCPTQALLPGDETPQLNFNESQCVQCGLCRTACPEAAISLTPRFVYDPELRRSTRVLHEEAPLGCIACGKPFATRSVIERMEAKLKGHWMFQDGAALRRLRMCEDCRVHDLHADGNRIAVNR